MKNYNIKKLDRELRTAGVPFKSVSSNGDILFSQEATLGHRHLAEQILAHHDAEPIREQELRELGFTELQAAIVLVAANATTAPGWAQELLATTAAKLRDVK